MDVHRRNAKALQFKHSQSLASLLHRFSQPMVRSTIQRLGRTTNAFAASDRFEIAMRRTARREVLGNSPPLAAGGKHVHQSVHDFPHVNRALAASALRRLNQRPFFIGQVAWIAQFAAVIEATVLIRPHRRPRESIWRH